MEVYKTDHICVKLNMWKMQMLYLVSIESKLEFCDYNLFSRQKVENSLICATLNMKRWKMQMLYLVSFVSEFKFCDYNLFCRQNLKIVVFYHWKQELVFLLSTLITQRFS